MLLSISISSQTTVVLRPQASIAKDAHVHSRLESSNFGENVDFLSASGTNSGIPYVTRALINFDLSWLPYGATIEQASLSLYSYESLGNGTHSTQSGSNASKLQRVTSGWDESIVTWETQPYTTNEYEQILPESTSDIQHYLDIDVTNMVQEMVDKPNSSYGFRLSLITEELYRKLVFASSDNADANLHPKLAITYTSPEPVDTCVTLRPNAETGRDAMIHSTRSSENFGTNSDVLSAAWTNGGVPLVTRGFIYFDLIEIPESAEITAARLSLYSYHSKNNTGHSTRDGSNKSVLQRVISGWTEEDVTWDTQPEITNQNEVYLQQTTHEIQHFVNTDVTQLVQDMVDDKSNSFGFRLKLLTEERYRSMLFASSDNADSTLHPKLEICYKMSGNIPEPEELSICIYPNPADKEVTIDPGQHESYFSVMFVNSIGQRVIEYRDMKGVSTINVSQLASGFYIVAIEKGKLYTYKPLVITH